MPAAACTARHAAAPPSAKLLRPGALVENNTRGKPHQKQPLARRRWRGCTSLPRPPTCSSPPSPPVPLPQFLSDKQQHKIKELIRKYVERKGELLAEARR